MMMSLQPAMSAFGQGWWWTPRQTDCSQRRGEFLLWSCDWSPPERCEISEGRVQICWLFNNSIFRTNLFVRSTISYLFLYYLLCTAAEKALMIFHKLHLWYSPSFSCKSEVWCHTLSIMAGWTANFTFPPLLSTGSVQLRLLWEQLRKTKNTENQTKVNILPTFGCHIMKYSLLWHAFHG